METENKKDYFYITKHFKFNNFLESQSFYQPSQGKLAEQEGHHPDIWFGWGYAKKLKYKHMLSMVFTKVILSWLQKLTEFCRSNV